MFIYLHSSLHVVVKSYLLDRTFRIKYGEVVTQLKEINSGVFQGNVLGSVLYPTVQSFWLSQLQATRILVAHTII
jgi:hypothetical protein